MKLTNKKIEWTLRRLDRTETTAYEVPAYVSFDSVHKVMLENCNFPTEYEIEGDNGVYKYFFRVEKSAKV